MANLVSKFSKEMALYDLINSALCKRKENSIDCYSEEGLAKLNDEIDLYIKDGIRIGPRSLGEAAGFYTDYSAVKFLLSKQNFEKNELEEALKRTCSGGNFMESSNEHKKCCMDIAILLVNNGANPDSLDIKELKWIIKDENLASLRKSYKKHQQGLCDRALKSFTSILSSIFCDLNGALSFITQHNGRKGIPTSREIEKE